MCIRDFDRKYIIKELAVEILDSLRPLLEEGSFDKERLALRAKAEQLKNSLQKAFGGEDGFQRWIKDSIASQQYQDLVDRLNRDADLVDRLSQELEFTPSFIVNLAQATATTQRVADGERDKFVLQRSNELMALMTSSATPADLDAAVTPSDPKDGPFAFETVLEQELVEIGVSRHLRDVRSPQASYAHDPIERAQNSELLGLAFSGGGIRSATFNLGVLQGLAELKMLHAFDYLSTVSGGGYIGSWFAAWTERRGSDKTKTIEECLSPKDSPDPDGDEGKPIKVLREYSNYLTPQLGFFSADTWTMVSVFLRNTILNQLILIAAIAAVLLIPRWLIGCTYFITGHLYWFSLAAVALLVLAAFFVGENLKFFDKEHKQESRRISQQGYVQWLVVLPIFLSAWIGSAWLWSQTELAKFPAAEGAAPRSQSRVLPLEPLVSLIPGLHNMLPNSPEDQRTLASCATAAVMLFFGIFLMQSWGRFDRCFGKDRKKDRKNEGRLHKIWSKLWAWFCLGITAAVASVIGGLLMWGLTVLFAGWHEPDDWHIPGYWHVMSFGAPIIIAILSLVMMVQIGLLGRNFPDERREWWGRLGAWLLIYNLGWLALFVVALYGPWLIARLLDWGEHWAASGLTLSWIVSTVAGVLASKSPKTGQNATTGKRESKPWLEWVAQVAPYIFIIGLLLAVAFAIHLIVIRLNFPWDKSKGDWGFQFTNEYGFPFFLGLSEHHWTLLHLLKSRWALAACVACAGIAYILSLRIDVNEFSMHHFYKNRLVRCYLGASRWEKRSPNRFTGFDINDDLLLSQLAPTYKPDPNDLNKWEGPYRGPYPILNTALNLVKGANLAWQERKAESFIFTPRFCGYNYISPNGKVNASPAQDSYRPTYNYAYPGHGIRVGTATAISGAAASPNMGYHSSPAAAFLLTVFNVRLGWWLGNPRKETWEKSDPHFGLLYLFDELLGNTNEDSRYVYLSDGGHFENLGIYELVRRRCRYIVACDGGADEEFSFEDLGNAIRKCRTDFGVEIDIKLGRIRRDPTKRRSQAHCAVGTITYPDKDRTKGTLVYLKTSLTGDEPPDVLQYESLHPDFPHQSTGDQWFDESQFESYRKLGYHIAMTAFKPAALDTKGNPTQLLSLNRKAEFFDTLETYWYPPSAAIEKSFTKHAQAYDALLERLRKDKNLAFMDTEFFNNFQSILAQAPDATERRSGFYFCNSLIQLMEDVYLDLNLEEEKDHPHNAGWIEIFQQWADPSNIMFQDTWRVSSRTYGKRFRRFCNRALGLPYIE